MTAAGIERASGTASLIDPVGPSEIAVRLGIAMTTAQGWGQREVLPPPRWRVSACPMWNWPDVAAWAIETGRLDPASVEPAPETRLEDTVVLVGASELAAQLDITRAAVFRRVERGQMPPPRWYVSTRPVWLLEDVADLPKRRRRRARSREADSGDAGRGGEAGVAVTDVAATGPT